MVAAFTRRPVKSQGDLCPGRYLRFYNLQAAASFVAIDDERLDVPKGHQILHMITHMLLYGPVDLARLNWWEARHVQAVKDPVKRTRQNENFLQEMTPVVSRTEVVYAAAGYESSPKWRAAWAHLFVCLFVVCFTAPRPVVLCWTSRSGGVRFPASGRPEPIPRGMDGAREPLSWAQFG